MFPLPPPQSQAELYLGTSPLLPSQFRCSLFEAKWGRGETTPPATFLISSLQTKATTCLEVPDGSECWAWKGQGRHRGQLELCGPAPVPWLKWVLVDAEMRLPSREVLEPSRGQQEGQNAMSSERGTCLHSKEQQRGAGEQQELRSLCPAQSLLSWGCCPRRVSSHRLWRPQAAAGERQQVTKTR